MCGETCFGVVCIMIISQNPFLFLFIPHCRYPPFSIKAGVGVWKWRRVGSEYPWRSVRKVVGVQGWGGEREHEIEKKSISFGMNNIS